MKQSVSFKNPVSAISIEAECCLGPKKKKKKHMYNVTRHTGDQH